MSVESQVNNIADLNPVYPQADDPVSQGDNHIRNIKKAIKDTFPNIDGTVTASEDDINQLTGTDYAGEIGSLESRVSKNEGDIANNAAGIANNAAAIAANTDYIKEVEVIAVNNEREIQDKADKSYVDSQNSAQDAVIAQKADKSYVDSGLSAKADKSYVDSKNNAQDAVIAQKADKTYVDSQNAAQALEIDKKADKSYVDSQNAAQNSTIAKKADKTYVDSENSAQDTEIEYVKGLAQGNNLSIASINMYLKDQELSDLQDVNTSGAQENMVLTFIGGQWVPVKPMGGGMIKPVQQPATAGDFSYHSRESAYRSYNKNTGTVVLTVPPGKVFSLEYIAAYGLPNCSIDQNQIKIDGVTMSGGSYVGGYLAYDDTGGPTWPGNEGFNPIRVEQSISVPIVSGTGEVYISGMFTED